MEFYGYDLASIFSSTRQLFRSASLSEVYLLAGALCTQAFNSKQGSNKMRVGTQSILWGVHQFILHPILVYKAWTRIYARRPSLRETLCIFAHDLGYIGKTTMDGPDGLLHPEFGARLLRWLFCL